MMLKRFCYLAIAMVTAFVFQSCNDDENSSATTSRIQLKLVDAPGDYLEVNVNIIDVQYNSSEEEGGWKSFTPPTEGYPDQIDLTELTSGNSLLLTDEIIESGMLKQIRLVLGEFNTLVINEGEGEDIIVPSAPIPLDTPSAQQSGLKLKLNEELEPGFSYTFILDWNVQESVVKAGNSGKYILKPVIRVEAEANTGSIEGVVTGDKADDDTDEAVPLGNVVVELFKADAVEGDEPYATTTTNDEGYFLFEGLPTIDYEIEIEHGDRFNSYESDDITVVVNETQNVGTIILEVSPI